MKKSEIAAVVVSVLKEVQSMSGREWTSLHGYSTPIGTLDGFDSLAGMEATALIEEKLRAATGLDSLGDESIFSADNEALRLDQICEKILAALPGGA